MQADE